EAFLTPTPGQAQRNPQVLRSNGRAGADLPPAPSRRLSRPDQLRNPVRSPRPRPNRSNPSACELLTPRTPHDRTQVPGEATQDETLGRPRRAHPRHARPEPLPPAPLPPPPHPPP